MGWGLPAAIGASANGRNFTKVICLSGEGGFQMNIQELATLMHNKIPIKIFIFNNGGYLTIKQTQQLGFKGRLMGSTKSSGLSFPDYSKIAKSHKIKYFKIKNQAMMNSKIKKMINSKIPLICEVLMDPNEEQIPKAINRKNKDGTSIPTVFEDMYPFLNRDELKKVSFKNYEK
jgi:acetolactate synthase-1/2/3 large subunit